MTATSTKTPSSTFAVISSLVRIRGRDLLVAAFVITLVAAPMLFTDSGFAVDFTNHLWLTWAAGNSLVEAGHPSYFLNLERAGVFYPWFAFYGGSLYMFVGGISELLGGDPILAYVGTTTAAIAASYLGMLWIGRELGLRGWMIHAPALTVVTSAYYITNLYGRGAWTELMATAVMPPLLASAVHLVRARRWRLGPTLVFVVSVIVFSGSHNITLLWGSTVAIVAGLVMWLALGAPRQLPVRRLVMVGGLGVASVLVNAWYLLPDVSYAQDIRANAEAVAVARAPFFDTPGVLLDPLRMVPAQSTTPALFVQVPVWFLAWGILAGLLLLWRRGTVGKLRRAWIGVVILIGLLLGILMDTPLWNVMPFPFDQIQYPYRLATYIFYGVSALVLVGGLALQRVAAEHGRARSIVGLRAGLLAVCAVSIGLCVWQQWVPTVLFPNWSYPKRQEALVNVHVVPRTWYDPGSYNDNSAPVVIAARSRLLLLEPDQVHGDRFAAWMNVPPGLAPIQTNIAAGSYLVHISGLRRIGRNQNGYTVVRRERAGSGPVHVVVETARSAAIEIGRALSVVALLVVLAVLAWTGVQSLSARRRASV
jgi:hypothetical protein